MPTDTQVDKALESIQRGRETTITSSTSFQARRGLHLWQSGDASATHRQPNELRKT